ncbi:MAG: sodium:solute symporter [Planctomycetota bacterium]
MPDTPQTPLPLAAFTWIDWGVVGAYLFVVLAIGYAASRKQEDEGQFFLAGRRIPVWAATLSLVATSLSAATYIGAPEISFKGDLSYLILNIGGLLAVAVVALLFLPALYRANTTTIYGYLGQRISPGSATAAGVAFLVGRLLASGARLFMAGIAFCLILFGETTVENLIYSILVLGVVGTAYTCMGGIRAVIWTDTLQVVFVVGAAVVSIILLLKMIPLSVPEIVGVLQEAGPEKTSKLTVVKTGIDPETGRYDWAATTTLFAAFAVTFTSIGAYGTDHDLVQRTMTTRSAWKASLSLVLSQLVAVPVVVLFLIIGLLLSIYYGMPEVMGANAPAAIEDTRKVYPHFLVTEMPPVLAGLAMAGMFAAAMSSFDSAVNAMASSAVADVFRARQEAAGDAGGGASSSIRGRFAVAAMGAVLIIFAIGAAVAQQGGGQSLIDFALGVMSFAYAGLVGVFLTARLTNRGSTPSVIAALVAGAVVVLLQQSYILGPISEAVRGEGNAVAIGWPWWMVSGTAVSFAVCVIGRRRALAG